MDLDDQLRRYFGTCDLAAISPAASTWAPGRRSHPAAVAPATGRSTTIRLVRATYDLHPELVEPDVSGACVAPGAPAQIAAELRRLSEDPDLGRRWAAEGRRRVCERHDARRTNAQLRALFLRLADAAAPPLGTQRRAAATRVSASSRV